eukprot:658581-Hanusia_phi.AAC.1
MRDVTKSLRSPWERTIASSRRSSLTPATSISERRRSFLLVQPLCPPCLPPPTLPALFELPPCRPSSSSSDHVPYLLRPHPTFTSSLLLHSNVTLLHHML